MHARLILFTLVVALLNVIAMIELVRRRRLKEKYALLWLFVGTGVLVATAIRPLFDRFSQLVGVTYGPTLVFLFAIVFLLLVCVHLSTEVSRLEERITLLAEEMALMRADEQPAEPAQ